jgi:hypothetical protein
LKLKYDILLLVFAFNFDLRRYTAGLVLQWQQDVTALAEPSADAAQFVDKVQTHGAPKFSSLHELCSAFARVEVEAGTHAPLPYPLPSVA